jgi:CDP-glucose 4,6-dehydratase
VAQLLDGFHAGFDGAGGWETDGGPHPHEATLLRLDTSRAAAELGWSPLLGFDETIAWTAQWYRAYLGRDDVRGLTQNQIDSYMGQRVRLTSPFAGPARNTEDAPHGKRIAVGS